ncbi:adenosylcobinamide-GDP ribazoletransferase [Ornithinimicrobium cerasi]|uniref:adenosylcobinamide-GDP ribazoletransferase n=1 Tax=Ornithinimicrobium cerasi TaxID=2248773 RepID=UPI001481FEEA|nr:adenosylcobinamide-GDP ribazoletransferase [Ornithinimicrobium cerasi]
MRSFLDAVTFLTRFPLRVDDRRTPDLARASTWFPVVGALLGTALLLSMLLLSTWTSPLVAAVLVVTLEIVVTGALHLDGLADLADGSGGADRPSRLRIMKDHAVGVYGTAAVVLALLLEVSLLASLPLPLPGQGMPGLGTAPLLADAPGWLVVALAGAAAWSLSRAAMLLVARTLSYARDDGTGRRVVEGLTTGTTVLASLVPVGLCLLLGTAGVAMLVGALAGSVVVGGLAQRLLGGATGDVLGATAQVALLGALLGLAVAL